MWSLTNGFVKSTWLLIAKVHWFDKTSTECWSSRPEVLCRKGVLKIFAKSTGKHLWPGLRPATLLKKRLWHWCSPVNFVKFSRTSFLQNTSCGCFSKCLKDYLSQRKHKIKVTNMFSNLTNTLHGIYSKALCWVHYSLVSFFVISLCLYQTPT